jgi:hypothetical protein
MRFGGTCCFHVQSRTYISTRLCSVTSEKAVSVINTVNIIMYTKCSLWHKGKGVLNTWNRRILSNVCGQITEHGIQRITTDQNPWDLYKSYLWAGVEREVFEWLGYVNRVDGQRVSKNIVGSKQEGRRNVERSRLRWLEAVVKNDLREFDVTKLGTRQSGWS